MKSLKDAGAGLTNLATGVWSFLPTTKEVLLERTSSGENGLTRDGEKMLVGGLLTRWEQLYTIGGSGGAVREGQGGRWSPALRRQWEPPEGDRSNVIFDKLVVREENMPLRGWAIL
jgi:hypothetical protein